MKYLNIFAFVLAASLAGFGCGDEHDHGDDHNHDHENNHAHDPQEEGCEHMGDGPFADATAAADATGTLENVAVEHTRVNIALTDFETEKGGVVSFEAPEAGDYIFFLSDAVDISVASSDGTALVAEASEGESTLCPGVIAASHTYELAVGTYTITLGPTSADSVGIVYEVAGHDDHAHEE